MVKAGTKQVIRAEKWVAEYRRWVGSGMTQRSYCGQVGLIFTQFKAGVEAAMQQGMLERAKAKGAQESKVMSNSEGFAPVRIQVNIRGIPVERPTVTETTAHGGSLSINAHGFEQTMWGLSKAS